MPSEAKRRRWRCEYDGFVGDEIGTYVTREGKFGLVLQQVNTLVVHVYRRDRLTEISDAE